MEEKEDQEKEATTMGPDSKEPNELKDVIYIIKPALIFENCFGIFRFRVIDNVLQKTTVLQKFCGILIMLFYMLLYSRVVRFPNAITGTGSLVDAINEIPAVVILLQYVASVITILFFLGETTMHIFTSMAELDTKLRLNMDEDFYKVSRKRTIQYIIMMTLSHVLFCLTDILTDSKAIIPYKIISLAVSIEQDIEILVFCKMVYMLKVRLGVINDYLAKFVLELDNKSSIFTVCKKDVAPEKKFNFIGRSSVNNMKIRDLAAAYDIIGETCTLINNVFNFQIFMNLVSTFTYVVITIWTSLYYYRTPEDISGELITVLIWCVMTVFSVAVMAFTCEYLLSTRRNTKILVNEIIMDYDLPKTMRVQAKVFMELIDAWPLRIFVYDMFSVDITLMLKFISVATTYLIVVIQISHFV